MVAVREPVQIAGFAGLQTTSLLSLMGPLTPGFGAAPSAQGVKVNWPQCPQAVATHGVHRPTMTLTSKKISCSERAAF
jgi:hypothetical protein